MQEIYNVKFEGLFLDAKMMVISRRMTNARFGSLIGSRIWQTVRGP